MKRTVILSLMVVLVFAGSVLATDNKDAMAKAKIEQGKVFYQETTVSILVTDKDNKRIKIDNVANVRLEIIGKGIKIISDYKYYKLNGEDVVSADNYYQALNMEIPFGGQDITPKMRKSGLNLTLSKQMLRNHKYQLLSLCIINRGYTAVKKGDSKEAKNVRHLIQERINTITTQYGPEAIDKKSVLAYAGIK